jgi:hypothetical protein
MHVGLRQQACILPRILFNVFSRQFTAGFAEAMQNSSVSQSSLGETERSNCLQSTTINATFIADQISTLIAELSVSNSSLGETERLKFV